MGNFKDRKRKVDLEQLSPDDAERIGQQVGEKIGEITSEAEKRINEILGIYGQKAKIMYCLVDPKTGEPIASQE